MSKMRLCEHCIEALRSHGDKVYAGEIINDMPDEYYYCEFCDEPEIVYDCEVK